MKNYNWACIGCGSIANEMAQAMAQKGKRFYCVASRTKSNAASFAERYGIERVYDSAEDVFADENVDIVYIATPHNRHVEHIIKAANSKKHILCEKAITLNSDELELAVQACRKNGVILAEAMTIYHMPVYKKVYELMQNGRLGQPKVVEVNLGSNKEYDMTNRFFNPDLAGGAMLDIGVYALSFACCFAHFAPVDKKSTVTLAPSGVDEQETILLADDSGKIANVTLSLTAKLPKLGIVSFENGYAVFDNYNRAHRVTVQFNDGTQTVAESDPEVSPLVYEIEDMETAVSGGENKMMLDNTVWVMAQMTKLRREWGIVYTEEK